jgi:hypothetical protein
VGGRVDCHLLEPRPSAALHVAAALGRGASAVETLDQVVADLLELGHVRDVALGTKQGMGGLTGLAGITGVGRQLRLEARDLAAELPAAEPLVGRDVGNLGVRSVGVLTGLSADRLGARARRVDRPRQVARVDPVLPGAIDGVRRQPLQIGGAGRILGDEGPQPVSGCDQPLVLEPPVHRARRVHVHPSPARELANAGQPVSGSELTAGDQDPQPPSELRAQGQVVGTGQIRRPAGRGGHGLGGLCHCTSTLAHSLADEPPLVASADREDRPPAARSDRRPRA